jgi:hypothetical protein
MKALLSGKTPLFRLIPSSMSEATISRALRVEVWAWQGGSAMFAHESYPPDVHICAQVKDA